MADRTILDRWDETIRLSTELIVDGETGLPLIRHTQDVRPILEANKRLANNFTESRTRALGPTRCELWLNDVGGVPSWYRGVIQRGFEVANIPQVEVRPGPAEPAPAAAFLVEWVPR